MSIADPVFIKATVRNPALLENALLVFKTLRVGFPTNDVRVWTDNFHVREVAETIKAEVIQDYTNHDVFIHDLIGHEDRPFWIVDPDVIFYEEINPDALGTITGPLEPAHWSPYTRAWHSERLHTCLMRIDPVHLRQKLDDFWNARARTPWDSRHDLIKQAWNPGPPLTFHDTMSRVYAAAGGVPFDDRTMNAFTHLHAGSFSDLVAEEYPDMARAHRAFRENPDQARGLWRTQLAAQAAHRPKPTMAADPLRPHTIN